MYRNNYLSTFTLGVMAFMLLTQQASAQNGKGINSIYSAYGIGDYNMQNSNAAFGMNISGVALRSDRSLLTANPASIGGLQNGRFMFDLTFGGNTVQYITANSNRSAGDFSIRNAAFGMNIVKPLATVIGLQQLSNIEYYTVTSKSIAGTSAQLDDQINGTGGLNQVYLANSVTVTKHLTLGVTGAFVFGSANRGENIFSEGATVVQVTNNTYYNKALVNTGLQYSFKIKKNQLDRRRLLATPGEAQHPHG